MFSSITVEGFRCFPRFELRPLERINLLVGANNSGKSAMLEAIALLASRGDPAHRSRDRGARGDPLGRPSPRVQGVHPASGSYEQIKDLIPTELASRVRETVGIIVDADVSVEGRWRSLRDHCSSTVVGLSPEQWPAAPVSEGLVIDFEAPQGHRRLGLWIMPDNRAPGMIETFLQRLEPTGSPTGLRELAERSCDEATDLGAPFCAVHRDKAIIHTWLAWQDPPGRQLHDAIKQRQLDPSTPLGLTFASWFRRLYDL